jgi:hypothetical protein
MTPAQFYMSKHIFSFCFYCSAGIVAFTKYQTCHSWIHLLHCCLLPAFPHSWSSSFNRSHFFHLHTCVQSISLIFAFPHTFPIPFPLPLGSNPHRGPVLLWLCKKPDIFDCLRLLSKEFPHDIFMCICIIIWIVSSAPFFSFIL